MFKAWFLEKTRSTIAGQALRAVGFLLLEVEPFKILENKFTLAFCRLIRGTEE
jgi:hypothetical protein